MVVVETVEVTDVVTVVVSVKAELAVTVKSAGVMVCEAIVSNLSPTIGQLHQKLTVVSLSVDVDVTTTGAGVAAVNVVVCVAITYLVVYVWTSISL